MVISTNTNWTRAGLFLLTILFVSGILNNPIASSSQTEEIPKVEIRQIQIQNDLPKVDAETTATQAPVPAPSSEAKSYGLKIDAIGINIPLAKTGLGKNKELLVPENPNTAAWYKLGPKPGENGSALITGHFDSPAGPGVFYSLRNLKPDELIEVKRDDGKVATYKIDKLESYAQDDSFPWSMVYRTSGPSALRLITCDGTYNPKTQRYSHNLVVYASLVSIT